MYTQCISCATLFQVSARHLRQAQGLARCGLCDEVFDATAGLMERLPAGLELDGPDQAADVRQEEHDAMSLSSVSTDDDYFTTLPGVNAPEGEAPAIPAKPPRLRPGIIGISILVLILLAAAVVQYAYVMRVELAQYPRLRPWIEGLCLAARCQLPQLQDVDQIQVLHKEAGMHSGVFGELQVQLTIVNDAVFWQPYPNIRLRFLDSTGSQQTSRWFVPGDYLTGSDLQEETRGMPPQEPVLIRLKALGLDVASQDNFIIDLR